MDSKPNADS